MVALLLQLEEVEVVEVVLVVMMMVMVALAGFLFVSDPTMMGGGGGLRVTSCAKKLFKAAVQTELLPT